MTSREESCLKKLAELEEENQHLRRAAEDFGKLAERLSDRLTEERRRGGDRRQEPRQTGDRRKPSVPAEESR